MIQFWQIKYRINLPCVFDQLNKSIPSTMNQLYPLVEQVLKDYSEEAVLRLIGAASSNPGEKTETFECPANYEYILKRFIGACLARDPTLKFNAYFVLTLVAKNITTINLSNLYKFIHSQTNYKKHCQGKFIQIQAYVIGKILIVKALAAFFAGHLEMIGHLVEISTDFPEFEDQIIQLVFQLVKDKKSKSLFKKLSTTTKCGFLLFTILQAKLTKGELLITKEVVDDALSQVAALYPKRSILLSYLGPLLSTYIESPAQFLQARLEKALGSEEVELNVKNLYFILQLIESHLRSAEITSQNLWKTISVKLLSGWLFQLKVKNKHIRKLAESISIRFEAGEQLAFTVLKEIHQKELNLDNINNKHPLFSLYENVEPHTYVQYLLEINEKLKVQSELQQEKEQPQNKVVYFNELQFFVVLRHKELTIEEIASVITVFISRYQANKEQIRLASLITILNAILKQKTKKNQAFKPRLSLILSKLDFNAFELGETAAQIKKAIKEIKAKVKSSKQQKDEFAICFLNFLVSFGFYTLIYPEQIQIFGELLLIQKDLQANILLKSEGQQPTKKRKVSKEQVKKPVHVLVDIFISLLTKSPHFFRISINHLFEQLIPYLEGEDLSHLLEVVTKPDHEYIEDTQVD